MLEFLIHNLYLEFSGQIFQQTVGIPMGTNSAPLLADLFLNGYGAKFIQGLLKACKKHLAQKFTITYRYKGGVLSVNNSKISEFIDLTYPCELENKDTKESDSSASYLDWYLCTDDGKFITRLYDKRDDFNFPNFPFLHSNIPLAPAYGGYVCQQVRYTRACCK